MIYSDYILVNRGETHKTQPVWLSGLQFSICYHNLALKSDFCLCCSVGRYSKKYGIKKGNINTFSNFYYLSARDKMLYLHNSAPVQEDNYGNLQRYHLCGLRLIANTLCVHEKTHITVYWWFRVPSFMIGSNFIVSTWGKIRLSTFF